MTPARDTHPAFARIASAIRREGGVDDAAAGAKRGFGSAALKVNGRIFAMPAQGTMVVKLPVERVDALIASGVGAPYDAGRGRVMREWVALRGSGSEWLAIAREAREFVGSLNDP
jgi:hypothetical protein